LQQKKEMKIGLIDVDGKGFPNLALMKISAYHKSIGDSVEWAMFDNYDRTYMSKVFTFSNESMLEFGNLGEIIKGGTGYNFTKLDSKIENMCPDYSIYPDFKEAYGFLTRGCIRKCKWCIVPEKEGSIRANQDIEEFIEGRKAAILMDNNVLSSEHGLIQIEKIIKLGIKIDFNQGLDARIIAGNEEIAKLLSKVKWYKPIRMACDSLSQMKHVEKATKLLRKYNCKPNKFSVYVLLTELEDSYQRINFCKKLKIDPFAQPYRDFKKIRLSLNGNLTWHTTPIANRF